MARELRRILAALAALAIVPAAAAAQGGGGTITGRVSDRTSNQPVPNAQVQVVGTSLGALSRDDGTYRVAGVPAGQVQVRALRIGYGAETQTVTVRAGGSVTLNFALSARAVTIDEVVVTATGETQRRRESGVSTGVLRTEDISLAPVNNASDLLQGRIAGVSVLPSSGTAGANARIRIRGSNSLSLSNDPLVIIDGVRVNNNLASTTIGVGGQEPSRLNDLNPEDIANVEVVKGPAAAALYGTAAANGVLYITTKRGRAGETQWRAFAEGGTVRKIVKYPTNFAAIDVTSAAPDTIFGCTNDFAVRGFCQQEGAVSFNPLEQAGPFQDGSRRALGLSVSGGSDRATYYISGDVQREQGIIPWNDLRRANFRANVRGQLRDNLDLTANLGYVQSRLRLPQNDNNILGILGSGLLGNAQDDSSGRGYIIGLTPADISNIITRQNVDRLIGSLNSNWQALPWLSFNGTTGLDFTNRIDQETVIPNKVFFADLYQGNRTSNPFQTFFYTATGSGTAVFRPTSGLQSSTTVGAQYNSEFVRGTYAYGQVLLPGTGSLSGASSLFAVDEANTANVTIGGFVQEELAWRDRLFLVGAVRTDKNSAFGFNFKSVTYPSASISWVVGEEPFFPDTRLLSALRLRAAYGESGQRPGFRDAVRFYTPAAVTVAGEDVPGFVIGGVGNARLAPERSKEYELGFDAGFLTDRLNLNLTYYNKRTTDALVSVPLPPSNGEALSQFQNLGVTSNRGVEVLANAQIVRTDPVQWDVTVNASTNRNRVEDLGKSPAGDSITPIIFNGGRQRHQNGYPLGGYWQRPILSFNDTNGDGIIARDEVELGDTAVFLGTPFPTREISVTSGLTLFRVFRVSGLLDYRGGQKLLNLTERFRCVSFGNCRTANDPTSPLASQAAYIAGLLGSDAGYIENASFVKLRELAVTISMPTRFAQRVGARGLSLTLAGRNLKTWTDYTGFDPELISGGGFAFSTSDFLTLPPNRYYTARLDLTF